MSRRTRELLLGRFGAWTLAGSTPVLGGCAVMGNVAQFDEDYYQVIRRAPNDSLATAWGNKRLYVQQRADTLLLTPETSAALLATYRYFF